MKEYNKFLGIDVIRVVSMFCVIVLHCASNRLRVEMGNAGWDIVNYITAFATCGVPMFFMISGALILRSKNTYSIKYTLKERVLRLLIPMFIWSVIAAGVRLYADESVAFTTGNLWGEMINFLREPVAVHLWFMYYLIPMYLISPALKSFIDNAEGNVVKYIIVLWLIQILSFTLTGIFKEDSQIALVSINLVNNIGFISGYLGYFILGWYIFDTDVKISNLWLVIIALGAVIFISVGTKTVTEYNGFYTETFKSYRSIFVVVLSSAVFILLNRIKRLPKFLQGAVAELAAVSYGVYLSHNVIIDLLNRWGLKNHSLIVVCETFVIASVSSVVMMMAVRRIKYVSVLLAGGKRS